ncbi:hypothetical protein [Priestia flexa]|uniref:hypothetical protein n=1 Tax=Priestia flexa TaxID=86664 RepID=UPI001F4CCEFC|nr:hypothetical protein [Priestia flexa]
MEENQFSTNYLLQVSRLVGEIQHLSTLVTLLTDMKSEVEYSSNVNKFSFVFAPTEEVFKKRFLAVPPDRLIEVEFYVKHDYPGENYIIKELFKVKRFLKDALRNKGVDYGKLDYTTEMIEYTKYII